MHPRHLDAARQSLPSRVACLLELVGHARTGRPVSSPLSGGMRQRVLLAMALSCDPELLIVDVITPVKLLMRLKGGLASLG